MAEKAGAKRYEGIGGLRACRAIDKIIAGWQKGVVGMYVPGFSPNLIAIRRDDPKIIGLIGVVKAGNACPLHDEAGRNDGRVLVIGKSHQRIIARLQIAQLQLSVGGLSTGLHGFGIDEDGGVAFRIARINGRADGQIQHAQESGFGDVENHIQRVQIGRMAGIDGMSRPGRIGHTTESQFVQIIDLYRIGISICSRRQVPVHGLAIVHQIGLFGSVVGIFQRVGYDGDDVLHAQSSHGAIGIGISGMLIISPHSIADYRVPARRQGITGMRPLIDKAGLPFEIDIVHSGPGHQGFS